MLLANVISLTPGTLSLDVSEDRKTLYIHAMYASDPEAVREEIREGLEKRLLWYANMMELTIDITIIGLMASLIPVLIQVIKGPSLPDRVIALDVAASIVVAIILAHCIRSGSLYYLTAATVVALRFWAQLRLLCLGEVCPNERGAYLLLPFVWCV